MPSDIRNCFSDISFAFRYKKCVGHILVYYYTIITHMRLISPKMVWSKRN